MIKPDFDITKHEWSDKNLSFQQYDGIISLERSVEFLGYSIDTDLNKDDVIALARHFKLKPEDLT